MMTLLMLKKDISVTEKDILIPGGTLAGLEFGKGNSERVLALHGWLDNASSFIPMMKQAHEKFHWISIDFPGHGHSFRRPPGAFYHFIDWVPLVEQCADVLEWESFHLLGHSMGAGVASLAAGVLGDRIKTLNLIEGLGPLTSKAEEAPNLMARHLKGLKSLEKNKRRIFSDIGEAAQRLSEVYVGLSAKELFSLAKRGLRQVDGGWAWSADPRLRVTSPLRFTEEQVLSYLRAINIPVSLVLGDKGLSWQPEVLSQRMGAINNLVLKRFSGGHHLHMNLAREVYDFVCEHCLGIESV